MADVVGHVPFHEFFSIGNNYKYCRISGVFSALGAPRKVVDTNLESATHVGVSRLCTVSRIFKHRE